MNNFFHLFVDDVRDPVEVYPDDFTKWSVVRTYEDAIEVLEVGLVESISLDHDLGQDKTGYDICKWMTANDKWPEDVHFHSMNPVGMKNMVDEYLFYMKYKGRK